MEIRNRSWEPSACRGDARVARVPNNDARAKEFVSTHLAADHRTPCWCLPSTHSRK